MANTDNNKRQIHQILSGDGKLIYPTKSIRAPIIADVIKIGVGVFYPTYDATQFYTAYSGAICKVRFYTSSFKYQKAITPFKMNLSEGDFIIGGSEYHIVASVENGAAEYGGGSYPNGLIGPLYDYSTSTYQPSILFATDNNYKSKLRQLVFTLDKPVKLYQIGYCPFGYMITRDAVQMLSVECYNKGTPVAVSGWFRIDDGCVANNKPTLNIRYRTEFVFNGLGSYLSCPDSSVTCQMVKDPVQD